MKYLLLLLVLACGRKGFDPEVHIIHEPFQTRNSEILNALSCEQKQEYLISLETHQAGETFNQTLLSA